MSIVPAQRGVIERTIIRASKVMGEGRRLIYGQCEEGDGMSIMTRSIFQRPELQSI